MTPRAVRARADAFAALLAAAALVLAAARPARAGSEEFSTFSVEALPLAMVPVPTEVALPPETNNWAPPDITKIPPMLRFTGCALSDSDATPPLCV